MERNDHGISISMNRGGILEGKKGDVSLLKDERRLYYKRAREGDGVLLLLLFRQWLRHSFRVDDQD